MRQQGILKPGKKRQDKKLRGLLDVESLQAGIKDELTPDSFSIIFLRSTDRANSTEVGEAIKALLEIYNKLGRGLTNDLGEWNGPTSDTLSFIVGYGKGVFRLPGIKLDCPQEFTDLPDFNKPRGKRVTALWDGSGLMYSDVTENRADSDIVFRFLSAKESDTRRTIIETWKYVYDLKRNGKQVPLEISGYYTGFLRQDKRNMLDFLDGISNLTHDEREKIIFRDSRKDPPAATGTVADNDSTYMAYIRILVDLPKWRKLDSQKHQEIIGRDKVTGCPLSEETGIKEVQCPVYSSDDVLDEKHDNIKFRETPTYVNEPFVSSHVGRVRKNFNSRIRILRQGYNFVEENSMYPFFRTGLNFVSFQNSPKHIHDILTKPQWMGGTSFGGTNEMQKELQGIFTAEAATVVFVPQRKREEIFPGSSFLL